MIAEQGHYRGRTVPTNTRQGLYTTTAGGQLLTSVNTTDVARVKRLLSDAERIWNKATEKERSPIIQKSFEADPSFVSEPPIDGLALRMTMRDLPRSEDEKVDLSVINLDHVWITRQEMLTLIPSKPVVGKSTKLPKKIANRLAQFHLLDSVHGEAEPFESKHLKQADINLTVSKISGELIKFKIAGRCGANRPPSRRANPYTGKMIRSETGYDLQLYGIAEFDRTKNRFNRFDLLATGDRWGGTMYNFRDDDLKASPIGFAFQLIKDVANNPTPPRFYSSY